MNSRNSSGNEYMRMAIFVTALIGSICTVIWFAFKLLVQGIEKIGNGFEGTGTDGKAVLIGFLIVGLVIFGFSTAMVLCFYVSAFISGFSSKYLRWSWRREASFYNNGRRPNGSLTSKEAELQWQQAFAQAKLDNENSAQNPEGSS